MKEFTSGDRARSFLAMVYKQLLETSRYPVAFAGMFLQVFMIIIIFVMAGMAFSDMSDPEASVPAASAAIYGFVIFMFIISTLWEMGFSIYEEQTRGTLESLYLTPASKFANVISRVFAIVVGTGLVVVLLLFMMKGIGLGVPVGDLGLGLLILIFTISGSLGLGVLFAGITIALKESAQLFINAFQFFLLIFCAMFFPFSVLPREVVDYVSRYIPLSYAVDSFRTVMANYPEGFPELAPLGHEMVITALFGLLMPAAGYLVYRFFERRARRTGSLGEY